MGRKLLDRPGPLHEPTFVSPVPLRLLDRELDRELTRACALVGHAAGAAAQVILAADAGAHPLPLFWVSCNTRAAELCDAYGVEMLVVEEDGNIRIRIDRFQAYPQPRCTTMNWYGWWRGLWSDRR